MGFKKNWDIPDIIRQINSMARDCQSPYTDGFLGWSIKQDLYEIKFILDKSIQQSPNFGETEKEWLKTQEKKKIIKILKGD